MVKNSMDPGSLSNLPESLRPVPSLLLGWNPGPGPGLCNQGSNQDLEFG